MKSSSVKPPNAEKDRKALVEEAKRKFLDGVEENPDKLPDLVKVVDGERKKAKR